MDLVRVAVLASVLGAPAAAEIIKPWREWLCNYCAMGEPDLDNIAVAGTTCSDVSGRYIFVFWPIPLPTALFAQKVANDNFQKKKK